ncbi:MAG: 50S ribosomal protein L30 [Thermoplasmata archaeon]
MTTRAVIRLRSSIKAHREVKDTLHHLRLNKVNHCVLIPVGKTYDGMLQKVKDYVTWGEIKPDVLTNMIIKRGKLVGEHPITNQYVKDNTKHESLLKFSEAVASGTFKFSDLKDVKPVFRLHPPIQGFEGIKRSYRDRGSLGYRGAAINDLILKMLDTPKTKPVPEKSKPVKPQPAAHAKKAPAKAKKAPVEKTAEAAPKKAPAKAKAPVEKKAPAKKPAKEESK